MADRAEQNMAAGVTAHFLESGRLLDRSSLGMSLLALGLLFWCEPRAFTHAALYCSIMLGVLEKIFALRVAFDQRIFSDWSQIGSDGPSPAESLLPAFDKALVSASLCKPATGCRPVAERIHGALRLLKTQAVLHFLQLTAILVAGWQYSHIVQAP